MVYNYCENTPTYIPTYLPPIIPPNTHLPPLEYTHSNAVIFKTKTLYRLFSIQYFNITSYAQHERGIAMVKVEDVLPPSPDEVFDLGKGVVTDVVDGVTDIIDVPIDTFKKINARVKRFAP